MEIEGIYLHGGVKGFNFINDSGTQKEYDSFFKRFYDKITKAAISIQKIDSANKHFIIESISVNGKQFYDYTFMEYYVYDFSGRPSYLGVTIRLNAFYSEILDLYFILDTVFKKDLLGNLLLPKEATYMFTKEQIDKSLFERVMADIVQLSSSVLQDSNLKSMRSASSEKSDGVNINLIDCQPKMIEKAISQYGRLIISTEAPLQRENQSQQEINRLNQQWMTKWNDLQGKHTAAVNSAQDLNNTIQSLQKQISQTKKDLQNIQKEYEEYKSQNELNGHIINGLRQEKEAIQNLANLVNNLKSPQKLQGHESTKYVNENKSSNAQNKFNSKKLLLFICRIIIESILIGGLLFGLSLILNNCGGKRDTPSLINQASESDSVESVDTTRSHPSDIDESADIQRVQNGSMPESNDKESDISTNNDEKEISIETCRIDVAELSGSNPFMEKDSIYTISICRKDDKNSIPLVKGQWKTLEESAAIIKDVHSAKTTITPKKTGKIEIFFYVDGETSPIKRSIDVKDKKL